MAQNLAIAGRDRAIGRIERGAVQLDPGVAVETRSPGRDQCDPTDEARLQALTAKECVRRERPTDARAISQTEAPVASNRDTGRFTPPPAWWSADRLGVDDREEFAQVPVAAKRSTDRERHRERGNEHSPVGKCPSHLAHHQRAE